MADLQQILNGQGETLVVHAHLQQLVTFTRGSGVEFLPSVDQNNIRKSFIDGVVKSSRLKTRIKAMVIRMIKYGRLLLYLRPLSGNPRPYEIRDYRPDQYRADYDAAGDLTAVTLIYSYKQREPGKDPQEMWLKVRMTAQTIEKWKATAARPDFYREPQNEVPDITPNTLGFIPCKEVFNPAPASEEDGIGDFHVLSSQVEMLDDLTCSIGDNLYFFANSPLITSREAGEVTDAMGLNSSDQRRLTRADAFPTFRFQEGFPPHMPPVNRRRDRLKQLKRVVGGFEADESISQLQINAVPTDQVSFTDQHERKLRAALGGIDERGIETATESRVVYGKVMSTAAEKQVALFEYGLCEILEMALLAEEALYQASAGETGLPPLGDRTVKYRVGEVFQQTPESLNFRSITARNLTKFFGVSPKAAVQYVFPEKSETEIDAMIGGDGFPSDYLSTAIGMFQQLAQAIDPLTGTPIAGADGVPLAYKLIPFIESNLNYGSQFNAITPDDRRSTNADRIAFLAALTSILNGQQQQSGAVAGVGSVGTANVGEFDVSSQLPEPGSTVTTPTPTESGAGFWQSNFPTFTGAINTVRSWF